MEGVTSHLLEGVPVGPRNFSASSPSPVTGEAPMGFRVVALRVTGIVPSPGHEEHVQSKKSHVYIVPLAPPLLYAHAEDSQCVK